MGRLAGRHVEVEDGLGEIVRMDRAARHADDRDAGFGAPLPSQVVRHAHGPRRVARHGVNAAVGGAGADGEDRQRLGGQPVEPFAGGHRLARRRVVAEAAPVALLLDRFVGDRSLDDQHEGLPKPPRSAYEEPLDEIVGATDRPAFEIDQRPVHRDLGLAGEGPDGNLFDAGLSGSSEGDRVAFTAEAGVDPENMDHRVGRRGGICRGCHPLPPFGARVVQQSLIKPFRRNTQAGAGRMAQSGARSLQKDRRATRLPESPACRQLGRHVVMSVRERTRTGKGEENDGCRAAAASAGRATPREEAEETCRWRS